jgi:hypothetical protein
MFFSIGKWGIISFMLIFLIHYLYLFLMNTLTVPKIKDLVNKPNEVYRDMFATLHAKANPINDTSAMANELNTFLNDLKKTSQPNNSSGGYNLSSF